MRSAMLVLVGVAIGFLLGAGTFELVNLASPPPIAAADSPPTVPEPLAAATVEPTPPDAGKLDAREELKLAEYFHGLTVDRLKKVAKRWQTQAEIAERHLQQVDEAAFDRYADELQQRAGLSTAVPRQ